MNRRSTVSTAMPARYRRTLAGSRVDNRRARASGGRVDRWLPITIAVLCLIGMGTGGYLTYVHYADLHVLCLSSGGCETVQHSRYAKLAGVPVPVLGVAGYIAILSTLSIRGELGKAAGFGLALAGFLFSIYLTYRELFTIKAICQWCVGSAVLMTLLAIVTTIRALRIEPEPPTMIEPAQRSIDLGDRRDRQTA